MKYEVKEKIKFNLKNKNKKDSIYIEIDVSLLSKSEKHNGLEVASFIGHIKPSDKSFESTGQNLYILQEFKNSGEYIFPENLILIMDMWEKYQNNNLNAGTPKQMEFLEEYFSKFENYTSTYEDKLEALKNANLLVDNGVKYGSKWLFQEIPFEDLITIYDLIDSKKLENLIENYDPFEVSILRDEILKELQVNNFDFDKIEKLTIIHNDSATDFTEYKKENNDFKSFFSSRELKMFVDLKDNGRHIDRYIQNGEIDLSTRIGVLLAEIAIHNSPSAMRFLDLSNNSDKYTKEEYKFIVDELIEPYLINNGIDGLVFCNYLNDNLVKTAIDNSKPYKLAHLENYLLDLNTTSLNKNTKDISFDKTSALLHAKAKEFDGLSKSIQDIGKQSKGIELG